MHNAPYCVGVLLVVLFVFLALFPVHRRSKAERGTPRRDDLSPPVRAGIFAFVAVSGGLSIGRILDDEATRPASVPAPVVEDARPSAWRYSGEGKPPSFDDIDSWTPTGEPVSPEPVEEEPQPEPQPQGSEPSDER